MRPEVVCWSPGRMSPHRFAGRPGLNLPHAPMTAHAIVTAIATHTVHGRLTPGIPWRPYGGYGRAHVPTHNRSARAARPTGPNPKTGDTVTRYHAQPVRSRERGRRYNTAA